MLCWPPLARTLPHLQLQPAVFTTNNKKKCLIKHTAGGGAGSPPYFMPATINMQMSDDGFSQHRIPKWLAVASELSLIRWLTSALYPGSETE